MKIFELYFNPNKKTFKNFQHSPNQSEKKLGFLYMVGEVSEREKKNLDFLETAFNQIKKEYYKEKTLNLQKAFERSLKKANEIISNGDYNGKLDIALFLIKNNNFYISKIGRIKIIKTSSKKIEDLTESFYTYEPKLFQSVISGKINKKEKLIISTTEVNQLFSNKKITRKIKEINWNNEIIKEISTLVNGNFKNISGLLTVVDNQAEDKKKTKKSIVSEKKERFNFKKIARNFILFFYREEFLFFIKKGIKKIKPNKKMLLLIIVIPCLLIIGSVASNLQEKTKEIKLGKTILNIEEEFSEAKEKNDIEKIKELLQETESLKKEDISSKEINETYLSIKEHLVTFYSGEFVEELTLLGEAKKINPEKIIFNGEDIYLYSTNSSVIEVLNSEKSYSLEEGHFPVTASSDNNKVFFFSPPDNLYTVEKNNILKKTLNLPYDDCTFLSLSFFLGNPYFLDSQGYMVNYSDKNPFFWTKNKEERVENGRSVAIDGSVFILDKDGDIHRYYMREKKEVVNFSIFPPLSSKKELYTSRYNHLFVFDKEEERVVVVSKEGKLLKQLYLKELKGLSDIAVSSDGKKIYLLVNKQVYLLDFEI